MQTGYGGPSGSNETGNMVYEQVAQPKAAAFIVAKGSTSRSIGYREENAPTLVADQGNNSAVLCPIPVAQPKYFESHPNDSRVTGPHDIGNTVSARYGTGGGNTPLVSQPFRKVRRAKSKTDFETWEQDQKTNTLNCFDQGDVRSTNVVAQPIAVDWRTTQVDVEMTGTLKTDLAKMSGPCIAVDTYNYTTNKKTTQTIRSQKSDTEHIGAVMQPIAAHKVSPTLTAKMQGMSGWAPYNETEHLVPVAQPIPILAGEHPQKEVSIDVCPTLPAAMGMGGGHTPLVPHPIADLEQKSVGALCARDFKGVGSQYVDEGKVITSPVTMAIRRLTPKECERLQGFPDDWTKIPYRNKPADQCPDGPRYKACGNSMAVPVMRWIGERIQMIENYLNPNL